MLKIVTIVCVIVGLFSALFSCFWIRSKMGKGSEISDIFGLFKTRSTNFRKFQYLPVIISVVLLGLPIGAGISWVNAAVYLLGAVICFGTLMLTGAVSFWGITSASNFAIKGDVQSSLKVSYRTGSVMGLIVSCLGLIGLCSLVVLNKAEFALENATCLALGFAIVSCIVHLNGAIYSSAFELGTDSEIPDSSGHFFGTAADLMCSYVLSAVAAIVLAKQSVEIADVFATFNSITAIKFPLIILAVGIVASAVSAPIYRGRVKNNLVGGTTISCFIAAVITLVFALILSRHMLQSFNYAYAVASGLVASLLLGELLKNFSADSKIHIGGRKTDRKMDIHAPVIFNLSNGMMSTLIFGTIITGAMMVSYFFARNYGVALCAVGICSISGVSGALNWMGSISHSVYGILVKNANENADTAEGNYSIIDTLDSSHVRTSVAARSYSSFGGITAALALLMCFVYNCKMDMVDILDPFILAGMAGGAAVAFFLAGITCNAIRLTSRVIYALGHDEAEGSEGSIRGNYIPVILAIAFPALVGFLFGVNALMGFLFGVFLSGAYILVSGNNSGEYFVNDGHRTLGSLIKMIIIFSICYLPLFMKVDGFLF